MFPSPVVEGGKGKGKPLSLCVVSSELYWFLMGFPARFHVVVGAPAPHGIPLGPAHLDVVRYTGKVRWRDSKLDQMNEEKKENKLGSACANELERLDLSPHPSREGRGSFPRCCMWLAVN